MERLIADNARREHFLSTVLTTEFLMALDVAADSRQAIAPALLRHPEYATEIALYIELFPETISGEFPAMVALVQRLDAAGVPVFGLTNWAGDTFTLMRPRLPTLALLRDIVVSGHEGLIKPDHRIFELLCRRGGFTAPDAVFVDDSLRNVEAARAFGMAGIHHRSAEQTTAELKALGFPG
ncbi:MAG: HAD-IA family hydrolase [Proteobacteria bacterium]|nr:HAD-IA family hydrolase [Pseudomonadota bacterium]